MWNYNLIMIHISLPLLFLVWKHLPRFLIADRAVRRWRAGPVITPANVDSRLTTSVSCPSAWHWLWFSSPVIGAFSMLPSFPVVARCSRNSEEHWAILTGKAGVAAENAFILPPAARPEGIWSHMQPIPLRQDVYFDVFPAYLFKVAARILFVMFHILPSLSSFQSMELPIPPGWPGKSAYRQASAMAL